MKKVQNCQTSSPWMDIRELAEYLRFRTTDAARMFVYRHGVPHTKLGGKLLFHRDTIDEWMKARQAITLADALSVDP
jgi:excisionase family DNA binding protein